jgi:U3 small nucleolar RNA-associated protein 11
LGLLEKHKDYKERAYDFHKKQDHITVLKKKARDRNPDEFYYKMYNSQVTGGKHKEVKASESIDHDVLKLMKTQDLGYITYKRSIDERKAEELKRNLHFTGVDVKRTHKVFCESEADLESLDPARFFDTPQELVHNSHNRIRSKDLPKAAESIGAMSKKEVIKVKEAMAKSYRELERREIRAKKLREASEGLTLQRNLNKKGSKKRIVSESDPDKVVYKWKKQRTR